MNKKLKIVFISDTHGKHNQLSIPECDILVHSGDYTNVGSEKEYRSFYDWLEGQTQARHKVFIEGNHELQAENTINIRRYHETASYEQWINDLKEREFTFKENSIHHLYNSEVTIENLKFWGSPYTLAFYNWAFNMDLDELKENWNKIPKDIDILLTHGPPHGKMDLCPNGHRAGDVYLMQKLIEIKPKVHSFGHIHSQNPNEMLIGLENEKQTLLINAAVVNDNYSLVLPEGKTIYL